MTRSRSRCSLAGFVDDQQRPVVDCVDPADSGRRSSETSSLAMVSVVPSAAQLVGGASGRCEADDRAAAVRHAWASTPSAVVLPAPAGASASCTRRPEVASDGRARLPVVDRRSWLAPRAAPARRPGR